MPRQLPWKVKSAKCTQTPSRPKAAASPALSTSHSPAHRPTSTPKPELTPDPSSKPRRSLGHTPGIIYLLIVPTGANVSVRSPSTSPPPEPLKEEYAAHNDNKTSASLTPLRFMIEGVEHDDKYRMVEDEFLAVAGDFTRHLHAAEYQRLKNLAKLQNAETIQNISRPVTGEMTDLAKRRHAALDTAAKQRRGASKVLGKRAARNGPTSGDEGAPRRRPATSLQGLMDSPRKQAVPLALGTAGTLSGESFRGSMVLSPSRRLGRDAIIKREPSPGSEDDDLDGQHPWPPKYGQKAELPLARQLSVYQAPARNTEPKFPSNPFLRTANAAKRGNHAHGTASAKQSNLPEEDEDFFSRLRARRAEQKRRRESRIHESTVKASESRVAAHDEIPFL
ncbi:hypothetical protein MMYC01_206037 [Madurella mycetomatis]|uniref:Uncharacterized protein n=1 Tax=Madurella mycetomatis TaxID=100816 RepID=A0A175VZV6_9PEZI|nr:hypothetical protein MMYC01_206037 [Madurella mycetomatis]